MSITGFRIWFTKIFSLRSRVRDCSQLVAFPCILNQWLTRRKCAPDYCRPARSSPLVLELNHCFLQKPTLNRTHIVFAYAGDPLDRATRWRRCGETHQRGRQRNRPGIFAGWLSQIAFTGEYDGNVDVFVMPASGGVPKRLTWHPAPDRVLGWTADGKNIIFASTRSAYSRYAEMFTVPADGGVEEKLPLPTGYGASMSADGQSIAYEPILRSFGMWKDYRGGATSCVWLARLSDSSVTPVPRLNSNDFNPIWAGDRVYFLSDRNGPALLLFYYETTTRAVKEAIPNKGLDLKSASLGPDAIVYEQFGGISLYDLKTGKTKAVPIQVQGDFTELRAKFVNVGRTLSSPAISPNGARAVFTARGEVITVPAEKGDARDITNSPGVMERDPQWSPDGRFVAYLSDESGEYALHKHPQNGSAEVKKIALKPGFYRLSRFSPDSKKVALIDSFQKLWYLDIETGKQVEVAQDTYQMRAGDISGEWSPDSKWLAYSKVLPNELSAIHLYSLMDGKSTQVTDVLRDATNPVFDKDGKYLFFTASTNSGESLGLDIHAVAATATSSIYLAVLDKTQASPFAPESDEEKVAEEKSETTGDAKGDGKGGGTESGTQAADRPSNDAKPKAEAPQVKNIKVDLDSIDQRILSVPMPPRRYMALQVAKAGTLLAIEVPAPAENAVGPVGLTIHRYDFKTRKSDVALTGVTGFQMSFGGEKALYRQGDNWTIAALRPPANGQGAAPPAPPPAGGGSNQGTLKTSDIQVQVDPVQEWRQMYREAWRIERDWFYDRNIHGLDVKAAEKKYEPYLNGIASRSDLTYLFMEMLGNMEVSRDGYGRRRYAGGEARADRPPGMRLRSGQWPLSLRARLQRRKLEPLRCRRRLPSRA